MHHSSLPRREGASYENLIDTWSVHGQVLNHLYQYLSDATIVLEAKATVVSALAYITAQQHGADLNCRAIAQIGAKICQAQSFLQPRVFTCCSV